MVQPPRHGLTPSYLLEPECAKKKWLNYVCSVQLHLIKGMPKKDVSFFLMEDHLKVEISFLINN